MHTAFYKKYMPAVLSAACMFTTLTLTAQDDLAPKRQEEIIIKKKADKDEKMTIVIDGDKVTVNGKPVTEFNDDIVVKKLSRIVEDNLWAPVPDGWASASPAPHPVPMPPFPPMPPTVWQDNDFAWKGDDFHIEFDKKPMLGVYTEKDDKGAKVTNVVDDSPAEKAGLMRGDIIIKVDDKKVTDPASLAEIIGSMEPDKEVNIIYLRDKKEKKTSVKLGERKESFNRSFNFSGPQINKDFFKYKFDEKGMFNRSKLGIRIQDVEEGDGVKVIDLEDSSAAAKAGILKNDIITNIDGTDIKNTDDAKEKINDVRDKNSYSVKVMRNGSPVSIEVKIPKKLKTTDL